MRVLILAAIGICFSMTTVFRSDILATALSRIADLPTLPLVFLRTTIQAVSTYKSLVPFVANGVLPKLVGKRIWENAQLWDGFALLVKKIAPASFGALLQLPKEWLRDVVDRQPGLKAGLKGFLSGKPQARGALIEVSWASGPTAAMRSCGVCMRQELTKGRFLETMRDRLEGKQNCIDERARQVMAFISCCIV